ncbi:MAG TPA: protein translocase subunit SecF [Vicinamibacterales bacterium]|nr:protein translocase subunit SecF [Vicinamibacterales bacterium]
MRIFPNPNYNFIKWRWHALILSIALIWAGVAHMYFRGGLPLGIDFSGGTALLLQFNQPTPEDVVRKALDPVSTDKVVQQSGAASLNQIMVRLPMMKVQEEGANLEAGVTQVTEALQKANVGQFTVISKDLVGPVVGSDLRTKGIFATLFALGGILVYVAFRFRFTFALGAIVATFHDILITLVFLSWFGYDLSLNVIAALLTITGYSVNDTIVVFDRVRENQRLMRRDPLDQVVNKSVNQTLGRTIITSGCTLLAVLALYLFGGEVLRAFAFTMIVGVVTGTYSTVFIAAAIAIILSRRPPSQGAVAQQVRAKRA